MIAQASGIIIEWPAVLAIGGGLTSMGILGGWFTARAQGRKLDADAGGAIVESAGRVVTMQEGLIAKYDRQISALNLELATERNERTALAARLRRVEDYARSLAQQILELGGHPLSFPSEDDDS